jgi:hydrogenase maturation protease
MSEGGTLLVMGVGNMLMGDEGVGVQVAQRLLAGPPLPAGVELLDGGTGSFALLDVLTSHPRALLVDACLDGRAPGTIRIRRPRHSGHFPTALGAHDIGLRSMVEAAELLGQLPRVTLVTVSVCLPLIMGLELSPPVAAAVPRVADLVRRWVRRLDRLAAQAPPAGAGPLQLEPESRA